MAKTRHRRRRHRHHEEEEMEEEEEPRRTCLNYFNVIGYILNNGLAYLLNTGDYGEGSNADISDNHKTLISPPGWSFTIWTLIFIFQGIFTITQLIPRYASLPIVQSGINCWYIGVCIMQVMWSLSFTYEIFVFSMMTMAFLFLFLIVIVINQSSIPVMINKHVDFWCLRFPFQLHFGWITVAFFLNIDVLVEDMGGGEDLRLSTGAVALAFLFFGSFYQMYLKRPNFVVPLVFSWATLGIGIELIDPDDSITDAFSDVAIELFKVSSFSIFASIWIMILSRLFLVYKNGYPLPGSIEDEDAIV